MKLKSFGCSFIFGSDLPDDGSELPCPTASNLTWPALLAKHYDYEYECWARPGSGNLQIAEQVLSHAVDSVDTIFVVSWTWIDRFDYTNSNIINNPQDGRWKNWRTLMPIDTHSLAKTYYQGLHSEFRDKLCSLIQIKAVIDTLKQKQIPFLMTYMDELMFDARWNHTPAVLDLQTFIKPYMIDFEGQSFLQWSKKNNFEISSTLHPLQEAHQAAKDLLVKAFDKQNTDDLARLVLF